MTVTLIENFRAVFYTPFYAAFALGAYKAEGVDVVSLFVNDGERHEADLDIELEQFYRRLADMKHLPTSSQPSVEALASAFRRGLERGGDVLGVFISSKMSDASSSNPTCDPSQRE